MATSFEDEWQKLTLTSNEAQIVGADDDEDVAKNKQTALCLLGRLHT